MYFSLAISVGLMTPIIPNLHGSTIKLLTSSGIWKSFNKAGINFCLMTLTKANMKFSMFSVLLMKNVNLYLRPDVNVKYAAKGIVDNS